LAFLPIVQARITISACHLPLNRNKDPQDGEGVTCSLSPPPPNRFKPDPEVEAEVMSTLPERRASRITLAGPTGMAVPDPAEVEEVDGLKRHVSDKDEVWACDALV
jgi:hypothetical protein